jgi:hypothetical protein
VNLETYTDTFATGTVKTQFEDAAKANEPKDKIDVDEFTTYDLSMGRKDDAGQRAADFRSADANFDGYIELAEAQAHEKMWRQFFFGDRLPASGTATWFDYVGGATGTVNRDDFLVPAELDGAAPGNAFTNGYPTTTPMSTVDQPLAAAEEARNTLMT